MSKNLKENLQHNTTLNTDFDGDYSEDDTAEHGLNDLQQAPHTDEDLNLLTENGPSNDKTYIQYPWRWVNLLALFLCLTTNSALQNIWAPVGSLIRDAYETHDYWVSGQSTIFLLITALLDLPSVRALDYGKKPGYGMMLSLKASAFITIFG